MGNHLNHAGLSACFGELSSLFMDVKKKKTYPTVGDTFSKAGSSKCYARRNQTSKKQVSCTYFSLLLSSGRRDFSTMMGHNLEL